MAARTSPADALYIYCQCTSQGCWWCSGRYTDSGTSPAGAFVLLLLAQQPAVLVVHWQINWCGSQPCWGFCTFDASAGARGAGGALADTPVQVPALLVFLYLYP